MLVLLLFIFFGRDRESFLVVRIYIFFIGRRGVGVIVKVGIESVGELFWGLLGFENYCKW